VRRRCGPTWSRARGRFPRW